NPKEAVKNNIFGTKNVAEAAKAAKVKNFVMVSTDKANNPPNVMGSTKRIAEMIVTGLNEEGCTKFSAVRFGNVLGSRGSVIPVFREQIAQGGPITVTDFRMTR
ncbi:TPA: polysaccharide biosynthesis protein, partial [Enterococcus faecium]